MNSLGLTDLVLERVAAIDWASQDRDVQACTYRHLLDTLSVMIAGNNQHVTTAAEAVVNAVRPEGTVPVPGRTRRQDLLDAAWLGAVAGHGLELDDGYRPGSVHPGTVVIPAALAVAHQSRVSGESLLGAVLAGYEAMTLVARLAHPYMRQRGFHPTGTAGVFGSTIVAARLRGLPDEALERALGLAASSASGLFGFVAGGADVKRLHPGHAAREGVMAVLLAERGLTGPTGVLEGRDGFFQAFANGPPESFDKQVELQRPLGITECYIKPYPCCRHLQPAIDAVLALVSAHDLQADEISAIEVETYGIAANHADIGWTDFASSQLSFPFVIATAVRYRAVNLEHFQEQARQDPVTAALCARVRVTASDEMNRRYLTERPARLLLHARGRVFKLDVREALGSADIPLDEDSLERKFFDLTTPLLGERLARSMRTQWAGIDQVADVAPLIEATTPNSSHQP